LSPRDIYSRVPVSVAAETTLDALKVSLALAIGFLAMTAYRAGPRRVTRINEMQTHAGKSGFVGKEATELPKGPRGMAIALRAFNRALGSRPNVPKLFNRYALPMGFGLLNDPFTDDVVRVFLEAGLFA
jgi:hypothetical protein